MALTKLRDFLVPGDGTFISPLPILEDLGATRAMLTTDDGICQGYAHTDGRLWCGPLVTRNAGKITADNAAATAATADAVKTAVAVNNIQAEVTRILAIAAGSRTTTEKAFLGIAWLVLKQG
jgi:hypothetical protein